MEFDPETDEDADSEADARRSERTSRRTDGREDAAADVTPATAEPNTASTTATPAAENEATATEIAAGATETDTAVTFDRDGLRAGFLKTIPVALGIGGYGIAFGILADQAGLSVAEAALMSATVVAGASQIVAVELWADPIPIAAVLVTTFAINLRYSLMGAALQPWFKRLSATKVYGSLFVMADENWALTMRSLKSNTGYGAFLLGSGIAVWLAWVGATIVGSVAGGVIGDPTTYGFDFILTAVFLSLAAELWEGQSSLLPWTVSLATALITAELVPGRWYILLGGLAAATVEVIRRGE
ncbi:AzlC family ABC transporter permease [Natrialba aegyptia]|uniref:AzlC family protein n=1 Tax=Natrialba aegyptia DSM 13077 TaxID=1227491 RepID=M0BAH2_9EURY|nr:AzlC family ABC transporter permease [Natrialba aegyptia]ELZ07467.1 AzlC family protein [Natrialba aegyptia DSM 13077]